MNQVDVTSVEDLLSYRGLTHSQAKQNYYAKRLFGVRYYY